jgi:membrane-bound metal-dependent hydrolase YbcI (DUF457 family)
MNIEAHLACGWVLAHLGGNETRRFRGLVTFAAVAPDIDVISYAFGIDSYATFHHAIGHNIFFGLLVSVISVLLIRRRRLKVFVFTLLAYGTHYYGDYFFTRFPVKAFWPISDHGYLHSNRIGLDHSINLFFSYLAMLLIVLVAWRFKRTPLEFISPELDCRVVNLFRQKPLKCGLCDQSANEWCSVCQQPVCGRHGRITRRFLVVCRKCQCGIRS